MKPLYLASLVLLIAACTRVPDREADDRTPLTASCDNADPTRCLLPWPSNRFTVADDTVTGLRLAIDPDALPVPDRLNYLNIADGFSRVTGVAAAFNSAIETDALSWDPAESLSPEAALQVIVADPNRDDYGQHVPFRMSELDGTDAIEEKHLVIGRPAIPMAPATDHVFIITNALDPLGDTPRDVQVALGLTRPRNADEQVLAAWHAPTRDTLEAADVSFETVRRLSVFTTRSLEDTTRRVHSMMDTLAGRI